MPVVEQWLLLTLSQCSPLLFLRSIWSSLPTSAQRPTLLTFRCLPSHRHPPAQSQLPRSCTVHPPASPIYPSAARAAHLSSRDRSVLAAGALFPSSMENSPPLLGAGSIRLQQPNTQLATAATCLAPLPPAVAAAPQPQLEQHACSSDATTTTTSLVVPSAAMMSCSPPAVVDWASLLNVLPPRAPGSSLHVGVTSQQAAAGSEVESGGSSAVTTTTVAGTSATTAGVGEGDNSNKAAGKAGKSGGGGGRGKKKASRPRFAFQTRSDNDVLDDGYRWRKYGQKAVKNSAFPRSYYRCTHHTCDVKKQVQRLAKDTSIVVTTYEGVHNHPCEKLMEALSPILKQLQLLSQLQSCTNQLL